MGTVVSGKQWRIRRSAGDDLEGCAHRSDLSKWCIVGIGSGTGEVLLVDDDDIVTDAPTFAAQTRAGNDPIKDIAASAALFWSVGDNAESEHSTNGTSWTLAAIPGAGPPAARSITVGQALGPSEELFVEVGPNTLARESSAGAKTWTGIDETVNEHFVVVHNAKDDEWIALGGSATTSGTQRQSADGRAWDALETPFAKRVHGAADRGDGRIICVGHFGGTADPLIAWTTDGGDIWNSIAPPSGAASKALNDVAHITGDRWVSVGDAGLVLISEDNGLTWAVVAAGLVGVDLRAVAYDSGNDVIVAVGETGKVLTSETEIQEDPPEIESPSVTSSIVVSSTVSETSIGRLAYQFRG